MNDSPSSYPLVSVLIPSYNSELYLRECLESVLAQTYPNVEVIVVDDGSNDGSLALARSFEARDVRVIVQENRGQPAALNTAFDASRGGYLQYLDADDVLHPRKIETQMTRLQTAEPTAMSSGAWAHFRASVSEAVFAPEAVWQDLLPVDWLVVSWTGGGMMHVAGWLIPRAVVQTAGPWVESLRWAANVDADFFTRALLAATEVLFCPEAKSYYRTVLGSQRTLSSGRNLEGSLRVVVNTGEALLCSESSARTRMAFADNLQRFVYSTYPARRDLVAGAEKRISELGGSNLPPSGGPVSQVTARWLGWKIAKRLRRLAGRVIRV